MALSVTTVVSASQTQMEIQSSENAKIAVAITPGPSTPKLLRVDPATPRYFTDSNGKVIYLTGSHTWANFQDIGLTNPPTAFNYNAYLNFLQSNNHNFFRLWAWEQSKFVLHTTSDYYFSPSIYQRSNTSGALDGGKKFDLTKLNQAYFNRMRSRIIAAGNKGIYVSIMLFDGFSVDCPKAQYTNCTGSNPANPWLGHPFNASNNINGINGDPNNDKGGGETHTLQIPAVTAYQKAYIRKVINTVNDLDNVLYEVSNESNPNSQDWQYQMIDYIKNYESGKPKQHPVGMTVEYPNGNNSELFSTSNHADWVSPNGDSGNYMTSPSPANGKKVILIDTDHLWGEALPPSPSVWVWKSFTRGLNVIFMDCYKAEFCDVYNVNDPNRLSLVKNLGYTRSYAIRMNLKGVTPRTNINTCSTKFCLVRNGKKYLVYRPSGSGSIIVNLTAATGKMNYEWFNPANGKVIKTGTINGGASRTFTAPISGEIVLYIYK